MGSWIGSSTIRAVLAALAAASVVAGSGAAAAQGAQQKPIGTAEELAVILFEQHDPAELWVSDWEFILSYRDASPANKVAADRVWKMIQDKQKNGAVRLKIPVTVISAGANAIEAAITEANVRAQEPDLHVELAAPLRNPPGRGAKITVVGVLTGYVPDPFLFTMQKGEALGFQ